MVQEWVETDLTCVATGLITVMAIVTLVLQRSRTSVTTVENPVIGSMNAQIKTNHQSTDVVEEGDSVIEMEIEDIIKEEDT